MLSARHGDKAIAKWQHANEEVTKQQQDHEQSANKGKPAPIYKFDDGVLNGSDLEISKKGIRVPGYGKELNLSMSNPFWSFDT